MTASGVQYGAPRLERRCVWERVHSVRVPGRSWSRCAFAVGTPHEGRALARYGRKTGRSRQAPGCYHGDRGRGLHA